MSQPHRSTPAGPVARAAARPTGRQRRHLSDEIALAARDLQDLGSEVERGVRDVRHLHDLEERAHAIVHGVIASFRGAGAKPAANPLHVSPSGLSALW